MEKGFILPAIVIAVLAGASLYFFSRNSVAPSVKTQQAAKAIPKYKNAKSWEISTAKTICPFKIAQCANTPVKIRFLTDDPWRPIYLVYKDNMKEYGWKTNSQVFTSIPTSIVFHDSSSCEAVLKEDSQSLFSNKKEEAKKYIFTVSCN